MAETGSRRLGCLALVLVLLVGLGVGAFLTRSRPLLSESCTAVANGRTYELQPDQARNAALITAVATKRGMPARAGSIGIATAMQESKLRNIDYGDRDSLGLFQQRPSQGWGTEAQIMDPIYSTNAFYDALAKIDGYESMVITEVAQKVQRSAFPDAYAFHEPTARAFASALSGHSPGALTCTLREQETAADAVRAERASAVAKALGAELGTTASADGSTVTVKATSPQAAWTVASWAVAGASELHVEQVEVAGRTWDRASSRDGWSKASGSDASNRVVISLG